MTQRNEAITRGPFEGDLVWTGEVIGRLHIEEVPRVGTFWSTNLSDGTKRPISIGAGPVIWPAMSAMDFVVGYAKKVQDARIIPGYTREARAYLNEVARTPALGRAPLNLPKHPLLVGKFFERCIEVWGGGAVVVLPKTQVAMAFQWLFGTPLDKFIS